eukprot:scaffold26767_cov78-Skeletonema_dohrnii-CCMP3373.AAC.3
MHCSCRNKSAGSLQLVRFSISSKYVISYQAGSGSGTHLDGDVLQGRHPFSTEAITLAIFLLVIYCYCRSGSPRPLESVAVDHDIIVEAPREIMMSGPFSGGKNCYCYATCLQA